MKDISVRCCRSLSLPVFRILPFSRCSQPPDFFKQLILILFALQQDNLSELLAVGIVSVAQRNQGIVYLRLFIRQGILKNLCIVFHIQQGENIMHLIITIY